MGQDVLIADFFVPGDVFWLEGRQVLGEDGWVFCNTKGTKDCTRGHEEGYGNKLKRGRFCNDCLWINK